MYRILTQLIIAISLLATVTPTAARAQDNLSLRVVETANAFKLTVPVSKIAMIVPKGSLINKRIASGGATDSPRYFSFKDPATGLIISGWFESADGFSNIQTFWASNTASWREHGLPEPNNVSFKNLGDWHCVAYTLNIGKVTNSHLLAELVKNGTWIDAHLSITNKKSVEENQLILQSFLQSISIESVTN